MSFPDKQQRKHCWDNRDLYWDCLDKHNNNTQKCVEARQKYENACPNLWVKHFDRKRDFEKYKKKLEQGYDPLEEKK